MISMAYLEGFEATKNKKYADVVDEVFTYVLRDMTNEEGAFLSAEDADSEGAVSYTHLTLPTILLV